MIPFFILAAVIAGMPLLAMPAGIGLMFGATADSAIAVGLVMHLVAGVLIGMIFGAITAVVGKLGITSYAKGSWRGHRGRHGRICGAGAAFGHDVERHAGRAERGGIVGSCDSRAPCIWRSARGRDCRTRAWHREKEDKGKSGRSVHVQHVPDGL